MATPNNKKPTPAKNTAPAAAKINGTPKNTPVTAAPKDKDADLDDDLDDEVETGEKGEGGDAFNKLPPAKRVAVRLGNEVNRLTKQFDTISKWPAHEGTDAVAMASTAVGTALENLKKACEALTSLPETYRPRVAKAGKAGGASKDLKPGDFVRITDKRKEEYVGVLEDDHMTGIKVIEVRGNKVVAITKDGVKAMFARGHVCLDETAAA